MVRIRHMSEEHKGFVWNSSLQRLNSFAFVIGGNSESSQKSQVLNSSSATDFEA